MDNPFDIQVNGKIATDEQRLAILSVLAERKVEIANRPIRHWTIDFVMEQQGRVEQ